MSVYPRGTFMEPRDGLSFDEWARRRSAIQKAHEAEFPAPYQKEDQKGGESILSSLRGPNHAINALGPQTYRSGVDGHKPTDAEMSEPFSLSGVPLAAPWMTKEFEGFYISHGLDGLWRLFMSPADAVVAMRETLEEAEAVMRDIVAGQPNSVIRYYDAGGRAIGTETGGVPTLTAREVGE